MRMRCSWIRIFGAVAALGWAGAQAQLTEPERNGLLQALYMGNMNTKDLAYDRVLFHDRWRMGLIDKAIQEPIASADGLMLVHQTALKSNPSDILSLAANMIQRGSRPSMDPVPPVTLPPKNVPTAYRPIVARLVGAIQRANADIHLATSDLRPQELQDLMTSLPHLAVEEPLAKFDFTSQSNLSIKNALELMKRVDVDRIVAAGIALSKEVEAAEVQLRSIPADILVRESFVVNGIRVELGGKAGDSYNFVTSPDLLIDLGGSNSFRGKLAGGYGRASVAIDLSGRSTYDLSDLSGGASLLGVGILRAGDGKATIRAGSLSLGSSVGGLGLLVKEGGDDFYEGNTLTQGFGMLGVGLLADFAGDDTYRSKLYSQGCARTMGVGWLVDRTGRDSYSAGGLSLNSPLFKDVYYSFSQGCGMGYREDTGGYSGGIGLLTDGAGDDQYWGETYCQAAAYWYGVGSLYDVSGNDTYSAYHYCQASAMHSCAAYLFDLAGDDSYTTKFGASQAIGHDYGVAFLLDRAGNDIYTARDSTPGVGVANGVGIFLDAAGDDRYQGPPGQGNASRGSGSIGIFLDLAGQDKYREGLNDGEAVVRDLWGISYDMETLLKPTEGPKQGAPEVQLVPGSVPMPTDAEMKRIYAKAIQWAVGTAQVEATENVHKLINIGMPAVNWVLDNRLASADRLSIRAIVQLMNGVGAPAKQALAARLATSTDASFNRIGLSVVSDAAISEAGPALPRFLKMPDLKRAAIRAAGAIKSKEAVPDLLATCADPDGNLALQAMVALVSISSDQSYSTAEALLLSENFPLRKAALDLVAKFPDQAMVKARKMASSIDEREGRIGVELLSKLGTPDALSLIGTHLLDASPGMRMECLRALAGRCPDDKKQQFLYLRSDPDPAVKALAQRLEPIR